MEVPKCYCCGFGFPWRWIDSVTFYLIQPLNFKATEEIFIEASYAFNALVGALTHSLKQLVLLWEGGFIGNPPSHIWCGRCISILCVAKELACKKIICVWTCLYLIQILTGIPWWQAKMGNEEVLDGFDSLCPFRHGKDFLICQDQYWAELCTTACTIFH